MLWGNSDAPNDNPDGAQHCNAAGITLIGKRESCKLHAYQDPGGVWTIGRGHTGKEVVPGLVWTQEQADVQFIKDIAERAEKPINRLVNYELTSNQFSALCDFVFNIGWGNFERSSALVYLNQGDFDAVTAHMALWNKDHAGHVLNDLIDRRAQDIELFNTPDPEEDEMVNSA